jgi:hypothetical protein
MSEHALFSASKAHRWMACPGSLALEAHEPDTTSAHAEEGTLAHELAAAILNGSFPSASEMAEHIQVYTDYVRKQADSYQTILEVLIEQRVDYSDVIGQPDSFGTADCIILKDDTITIVDLKYGMGVKVDAEENEQLLLYALGALNSYGFLFDFKHVKLVIVQPRLNHVSEWAVSVEDLRRFGERAKRRAEEARAILDSGGINIDLRPGEKQCRFCKAKATCPALKTFVEQTIAADFDDLVNDPDFKAAPDDMGANHLGISLSAVPLIETWCKAVRAKAESELLAGRPVSGFKLVQGRNGHRKWRDAAEAEATLKRMKLKVEEMYDLELVSPTTAEKLKKAGAIGPRQWTQVQALITQKEGPPSVAPITDPRPVYSRADDFEIINEEN